LEFLRLPSNAEAVGCKKIPWVLPEGRASLFRSESRVMSKVDVISVVSVMADSGGETVVVVGRVSSVMVVVV
jgi:hypothetical protein